MREDIILLGIGPFQLTAYGLGMALAALAGLAVTLLTQRHRKKLGSAETLTLWAFVTLGAVIGGHVVWCLSMFNAMLYDYNSGLSLLWKLHLGGVTLYGGVLGGMAGAWAASLSLKRRPLALVDETLPGACAALCVGRLAEVFTSQGMGAWVEEESLRFFPLAVCTYSDGDYTEWHVPVFVYEALAALALLAVALWLAKRPSRLDRKLRDGEDTGIVLTLLGCSQIFLEQLRQDDYPRFGFVRFTQLAAIAVITAVIWMRMRREFLSRRTRLTRFALLCAASMTVIFVEFTLEKPQMLIWLRLSILLTAVCLILTHRCVGKPHTAQGRLALAVCEGIAAAALVVLLWLELPWENALIYAVMALAVVIIGWTTLVRGDAMVKQNS